MRFVAGWIVALGLVAGCTVRGPTCTSDADCGAGGLCDTSIGLCYAAESETDTCAPACAAYEACTTAGCRPRFTELKILTPTNDAIVNGATVQVSAQLVANPNYASPPYPETLLFSAAREDGGTGGSFGSVTRNGDVYTVQWAVPSGQAQFTLTVAHPTPGAVQSASLTVQVDNVPPTFDIIFPSAPARFPGSTSQADERDSDPLYAEAFRRDESVTVTVSASEPANNVTLKVMGIAAGGGEGAETAPMAVQPGGLCGGSPAYCGTATVNLSLPEMRAFRGTMQFLVEGTDAAGNRGSMSEGLKVTRWKWAFSVPTGTIRTSPAVGEQGTVYIGTNVFTEGKVFALKPDGTKNWEASVGPVASLAVGSFDGGAESVYVAANTASNRAVLYALSSEGGGAAVRCPSGTAEFSGQAQSAMAVTTIGTVPNRFETAMAVVNNGGSTRLYMVRPEASGSDQCLTSNPGFGLPETNVDGSLIASGSSVFYPTNAASIVGYTVFNNSLDGTASTGTQPVNGLALTGAILVGGGGAFATQGGLYSVTLPVSGGTTATLLPGTSGGRVWNPVVGPGGTLAFYGQDTGSTQGDLKRYDLQGQTPGSPIILGVGVLKYAPALGADGMLYTASSASDVTARSANDLSERWTVTLPAGSTASVALDCARSPSGVPASGKPGTLYVPTGGTLHAIIVDSPGLNRDAAAWPKYQRDARNTGNPITPVTNCP